MSESLPILEVRRRFIMHDADVASRAAMLSVEISTTATVNERWLRATFDSLRERMDRPGGFDPPPVPRYTRLQRIARWCKLWLGRDIYQHNGKWQ